MQFPMPNGPSDKELKAIISNDDAVSLGQWLEKGLPVDASFDYMPLSHQCARYGAQQCFKLLQVHGVDVNDLGTDYVLPPVRAAIDNSKVEMVHLLMSLGSSPEFYTRGAGNLLHMAAQTAFKAAPALEIFDRLLVSGAKMHQLNLDNRTPLQCTRFSPHEFANYVDNRYKLDKAISSRSLSKEELFAPRRWPGHDRHYEEAWSEMHATWGWMNRILPLLEERGESFTHEELTSPAERLAWAVMGNALPALNAHLQKHGEEPIGLRDFVDAKGRPTEAFEKLAHVAGENQLLGSDWVKALSAVEKKSLYRAMPQTSKGRVRNYHGVMTQLNDEIESSAQTWAR